MYRPLIPVAGVPGAWSSESLAQELRETGADSFVFPVEECVHNLRRSRVVWNGVDLTSADGVAVKKLGDASSVYARQRVEMLYALEAGGAVVVSSARAIDDSVDRYRMTAILARAGVPVPRTVVTESMDEGLFHLEQWGAAVAKPLFTSKGRGMLLLTEHSASRLAFKEWMREERGPFYLQEFVEGKGVDVAVPVLGGAVLGSYSRVAAPGQWQTTTRTGGRYAAAPLTDGMREIALTAAGAFGLDYTTVDMVETRRGWLVYEVSAFGGFSGMHAAHGTNTAQLYAEHIYRTVTSA